jgi:RNA polymerase sigma-70 factor, ECF subfamily
MLDFPETEPTSSTPAIAEGEGGRKARNIKEIYGRHARTIYNYLLWMTKDVDTSGDILQTVFIRAWESRSLPENEEALKRWLFTTARNAFFDTYRSHRRHLNLRVRYAREYEPPQEPDSNIFRELVDQCSDDEKSILYLHLKAGYSYAEIAPMLELSESNVRVKACRAVKRLRELMTRRKSHEK